MQGLSQGQAATLNYEMFELVFPPGVEADDAKVGAYRLAKANDCVIAHRADRREVSFIKQ